MFLEPLLGISVCWMYQNKKALPYLLCWGIGLCVTGRISTSEGHLCWVWKKTKRDIINHLIDCNSFTLIFFELYFWIWHFLIIFFFLSLNISLVLLGFDSGLGWGGGSKWCGSVVGVLNTYTYTVWPGCSLRGDSNSPCSVPPVVSSLQWQKIHPLFRIP